MARKGIQGIVRGIVEWVIELLWLISLPMINILAENECFTQVHR
jgi:hypothetical protein